MVSVSVVSDCEHARAIAGLLMDYAVSYERCTSLQGGLAEGMVKTPLHEDSPSLEVRNVCRYACLH